VANQTGSDAMGKPGAAAAVAAAIPTLSDEAKAVLKPEHSPKQYLDALAKAGHLHDAVRVMAFTLNRREAIWWALQCVRKVPALATPEKAAAALAAAEAWAEDPTDDKRRLAFAAGEAAPFETAAGCVALAAFFIEGSLSPAHLQPVPAPSHSGPAAASTAVVLAAVTTEPEKADEKYKAFLALGHEVAAGTNRWKAAKTQAGPAAGPAPRPTAPPPPPSRGYY
jgi:hypothetical protein